MKLQTPVQVSTAMVQKYEQVLSARLALTEADAAVVRRIESELEVYREDMKRDFTL
eukprot:SAG11_NODE_15247_length_584_cov_0.744330_1_plen_55_part_10